MKYLKVLNLKNSFGQIDYKGLDINKFIPGSQVYPNDLGSCLVATNEVLETLPIDVEELIEADYFSQRYIIEDSNKTITEAQDTIAELQAQNAQILLALVKEGKI